MKYRNEHGFSLIELLLVVVIAGIIAALAIPALKQGIRAAENGNTFATLRTINSTQVNFYSSNNRFARLDELNNLLGRSLGTVSSNQAVRNQFTFEMVPAVPTDTELRDGFIIKATRNVSGDTNIYQYELTQTGEIRQILPGPLTP